MSNWGSTLGAMGVLVLLSACTAQEAAPPLQPVPAMTAGVPLTGHALCGDHVMADFKTDDEMYAAVAVAEADGRVRKVYTENKEEAFEHFKVIFSDHPDKLKLGRAEAMPSGLKIMPNAGADVRALAEDLRPKYPQAKRVEPFVRPAVVPGASECPPDGEWPAK